MGLYHIYDTAEHEPQSMRAREIYISKPPIARDSFQFLFSLKRTFVLPLSLSIHQPIMSLQPSSYLDYVKNCL